MKDFFNKTEKDRFEKCSSKARPVWKDKVFYMKKAIRDFSSQHIAMSYTVMLVPHANKKPINLKMPVGVILGIILALFILLGCTTHFAYQSYSLHKIAVENTGLKKITAAQESKLKTLTEMSDDMMNQLVDIQKQDNNLRKKLGMKITYDGVGGVEDSDTYKSKKPFAGDVNLQADLNKLYENLTLMQQTIDSEKSSYKKIKSSTDAKIKKDNATPSHWPISGGTITSKFGVRENPFYGFGQEVHGGIDIACAIGTSIHAAGSGTVTEAGYEGGYGRTITIDHGYGYTSKYSHCSQLYVKKGDSVKVGEKIAAVGNTGRSTGSHLDFRITYNGDLIDPLKILN